MKKAHELCKAGTKVVIRTRGMLAGNHAELSGRVLGFGAVDTTEFRVIVLADEKAEEDARKDGRDPNPTHLIPFAAIDLIEIFGN